LSPSEQKAIEGAFVEVLFVVLPLIVLTVVLAFTGISAIEILQSPEWSFAGAIMMGQSIVKVVQAASLYRKRVVNAERVALIITLIIVFGLAPSLVLLAFILISKPVHLGLIVAQDVFLVGSIILFMISAVVSRQLITDQQSPVDAGDQRD